MNIALCIDPGHGSDTKEKTGGKYSPLTGMEEFEFNNGVSKYIMEICDQLGIEYINVSPEDTDTPLYTRTQRANIFYKTTSIRPCIYISLHANAGGGTGTEIWIHSKSIPSTIKLANTVLNEICSTTEQKNRGVKKGYVSNPNLDFHVNRETEMVSMLVEYAFMDSEEDSKKLLDESFRKKCAESTLKGILRAYGIEIEEIEDECNCDNEKDDYKHLWQQEKKQADEAEEKLKKISEILK